MFPERIGFKSFHLIIADPLATAVDCSTPLRRLKPIQSL